jgi:putative DNA primase/helicase
MRVTGTRVSSQSQDSTDPRTPLDAAREYLARGWQPIPVPAGAKAPAIRGWPQLRLSTSDLPERFGRAAGNIGVLLGMPSHGLVDVDLDSPEALALAERWLPPTASRFGRPSKPASHRLYLAHPPPETEQFRDVGDGPEEPGAMLVELRATGAQTVFPPSVHPSGEPIEWVESGDPARLAGAELRARLVRLAVAALLARHWPRAGARHHAALAAGGLLLRCGLDGAVAAELVRWAARVAGDEEWTDRGADVLSTAVALGRGDAVTGGPRLAECLRGDGRRVVARIRQWLGATAPEEAPTLTDAGNATRFVHQHGANARYCYAWRSWLLWTGTHWRRDAGDGVMRLAKETAGAIYREAALEPGEAARQRLLAWAARSESEPGLRRMLILAQSELPVEPAQLDADPVLLNCPNGTLELKTLHLRPHRREDLLTKIAGAPYEPDARDAVWDEFLARSLADEELRRYVQRVAGYALTGSTAEEKLFLVHGPTAGGKSTFLGALRATWGDYATTADFSTFTARRADGGPRDDLARLHRARLVVSAEATDGALAEGIVKTWTGGDRVVARRLYEETFEFAPQCKLVIAANHRPRARDDDEALWRRIVEIPFAASIPLAERDPNVKAHLLDAGRARAAILAWAAQGVAAWFRQGLGSVPAVEAATAGYRAAMDPLGLFLEDACVLDPEGELPAGLLRKGYEEWCRDNGVRFPLSARAFAARLEARGCRSRRGGGGTRLWQGIRFRTPSEASDASDTSDVTLGNSAGGAALEGSSGR